MIILQDTREKEPWKFTSYQQCTGQIEYKLDAGDYALDQDEFLITIERKKSVAEISGNLGMRYDRFMKEMVRMQQYRFRYVICEFSYESLLMFPKNSKIPYKMRRKVRMNGKFLAKRIDDVNEEFGVEFIFCNNREEARDKAIELLTEADRIYNDEL